FRPMSATQLPRKTIFSGIALPVFSWGLPFHSLMVAMIFGGFGLSAAAARGIAAWKEIAVIGMIVLVMLRAVAGKGPRVSISWIDIAVASLLVIAGAFFIGGKVLLQIELPPGAELYGLRDIAFFLLLYFVGRASPEIVDDPDTLRRLYIVLVLTCAIAIVERIFVTPDMLVLLGVASYFQDFLNVSAFTVGNDFGLPMNYWTRIGNVEVQRAGSVYLSSQGFAVPFLILLPVATAWVFGQKRITTSMKIEYAIIWAGLLLSITRMTIIVCAIQLVLVILMLKKPEWAVAGLTVGCVAALVSMFLVPGLPGFIWDTLTWQTGSSASHMKDWSKGFTAFFEHPWGAGLGTTDQSAVRFGVEPLTADNGYFKYAVELGIQGLIALLAVFFGILGASFRLARHGSTHSRRLMGTVVLFTTIGVMLNATTGVVFNALVLSYLYFWFAGAVVTVAQKEFEVQRAPEAHLELSPA
ncbi:MAG TPA: O-antigen ligase family protein, partial [Gemmatimonadaceae bacterium]|nr:O-antigen ligase family protein [Gemmatimonadaceae bacterium]